MPLKILRSKEKEGKTSSILPFCLQIPPTLLVESKTVAESNRLLPCPSAAAMRPADVSSFSLSSGPPSHHDHPLPRLGGRAPGPAQSVSQPRSPVPAAR
ncbi:hypothetical protein ACRALDRAFT_2057095 [Sodiomyces alcalophilus JCM 7366]|uniref:uncharacterized protein n=1 Tax=Sodiomyces alcalophilus JCM 7366 TaxID=591952 RepID=UPI0039B433EC